MSLPDLSPCSQHSLGGDSALKGRGLLGRDGLQLIASLVERSGRLRAGSREIPWGLVQAAPSAPEWRDSGLIRARECIFIHLTLLIECLLKRYVLRGTKQWTSPPSPGQPAASWSASMCKLAPDISQNPPNTPSILPIPTAQMGKSRFGDVRSQPAKGWAGFAPLLPNLRTCPASNLTEPGWSRLISHL